MATILPFRDINVHASSSHYSFSSPSTPSAPSLLVDRPSGDLRLHDGKILGAKRVTSIFGILGILKLRLDKYIIVITKAVSAGRIKGNVIYRVVATEMLPVQESPLHDPDEDKHLQLTKKLLQTGSMYFSYSLDITNSFQRQAQTDPELPYWKRADDRFFWNRFIQTDLIDLRSGSGTSNRHSHGQQPAVDPYILPVMFGMLEVQNAAVKGHPFKFVLISRRSRHRAGTRYFSRGIDENGNVSNFNETEQAIILNDASPGPFGGFAAGDYGNGRVAGSSGKEIQVLSYVQTRGSVPVYWGEMNTLQYTPKLQIRGVESAVRAAKQHFDEQIRLYGDNYLVNLVNQKGRERQVKEAYEKVVRILASSTSEGAYSSDRTDEKIRIIEPDSKSQDYSRLHYVYFDFHNETKGLRWYRAQLLLDQLKDALAAQGYFHGVDMPGYTPSRVDIRRLQTSVVRTNCMDCLDRTNVIQSMLGRWMLSRMLQNLGILREGESSQDDPNFERLFRNVWADNADVVSKSYSGTGALKTDFTRTGDRTKMGMLQDFRSSVTRYMLNNFGDGPRQDAFDVFHGIYLPSSSTAKGTLLFVDKRPTFIQALPYVLAACIFFILTSMLTTRRPDSNVWPLRLLVIFCLLTASWCLRFIWTHGTLYVNWPKLNTPPWATDGYQEALGDVQADPLLGALVGRHERGKSDVRLSYLEEGKKRIE